MVYDSTTSVWSRVGIGAKQGWGWGERSEDPDPLNDCMDIANLELGIAALRIWSMRADGSALCLATVVWPGYREGICCAEVVLVPLGKLK